MIHEQHIIAYMESLGYRIFREPGEINIVYLEGCDLDGLPNKDENDRWNDLGLLIRFQDGTPEVIHRAVCTTEPGYLATMSAAAMRLGGVARIQLTQYLECWQMGLHKGEPAHPALVQCAPVLVHRDRNRDFKRPGDPLGWATGINHHGTRPNYLARLVGMFSQGCMVRHRWADHLEFIALLKTDPRYVADPAFRFSASYLDAGKVFRFTLNTKAI